MPKRMLTILRNSQYAELKTPETNIPDGVREILSHKLENFAASSRRAAYAHTNTHMRSVKEVKRSSQ